MKNLPFTCVAETATLLHITKQLDVDDGFAFKIVQQSMKALILLALSVGHHCSPGLLHILLVMRNYNYLYPNRRLENLSTTSYCFMTGSGKYLLYRPTARWRKPKQSSSLSDPIVFVLWVIVRNNGITSKMLLRYSSMFVGQIIRNLHFFIRYTDSLS